ncbi:TPA: hypothetical protein ACHK12_005404, partial [Escherichia coli]
AMFGSYYSLPDINQLTWSLFSSTSALSSRIICTPPILSFQNLPYGLLYEGFILQQERSL